MSDPDQDQAQLTTLVRHAQLGDEAAQTALARRAARSALSTASALVGSRERALDIAQDAAFDALRSLEKLQNPSAFDSWVHRMTYRHSMRTLRKQRLRRQSEVPLVLAEELSDSVSSNAPEIFATRAALASAMASLPPRQRVAIAFRYVHDLSDSEIGAALGCKEGTVHSLLSRARASLRRSDELQEFRPATPQPEGAGQ